MKLVSAIAVILIVLSMTACRENIITEDKAIEIATGEVKKLGYEAEAMGVKAKKYNTPLNEYVSNDDVEKKAKLKGKRYWAVYYYSKKPTLGGDVCVFIDSTTGQVITDYRGK